MIVDNDLLSVQHARIIAENAYEAQKCLAACSQDKLDSIVMAMASAVADEAHNLAVMSYEETDCGCLEDKLTQIRFACGPVLASLLSLRCVGVLEENKEHGTMEIGVPVGVIAAMGPVVSPVSSTVHQALIAVKAGNAILFSPHPRAARCTARTVEILIGAGEAAGLPQGCLACLAPASNRGAAELMNHRAVSMVVNSGVPSLLSETQAAASRSSMAAQGTARLSSSVRQISLRPRGTLCAAKPSITVWHLPPNRPWWWMPA